MRSWNAETLQKMYHLGQEIWIIRCSNRLYTNLSRLYFSFLNYKIKTQIEKFWSTNTCVENVCQSRGCISSKSYTMWIYINYHLWNIRCLQHYFIVALFVFSLLLSRQSCPYCFWVTVQTLGLGSLWLPLAVPSPSRTPSPQALSVLHRETARSWASETLTWTTSRQTLLSMWEWRVLWVKIAVKYWFVVYNKSGLSLFLNIWQKKSHILRLRLHLSLNYFLIFVFCLTVWEFRRASCQFGKLLVSYLQAFMTTVT